MKLMKLFTKKKTSTNPHYGDVVRWIEKVIDSCETPAQIRLAEKLIRLFEGQYYSDLPFGEFYSASRGLLRRSTDKWGDLLEKKLDKKKDKKK